MRAILIHRDRRWPSGPVNWAYPSLQEMGRGQPPSLGPGDSFGVRWAPSTLAGSGFRQCWELCLGLRGHQGLCQRAPRDHRCSAAQKPSRVACREPHGPSAWVNGRGTTVNSPTPRLRLAGLNPDPSSPRRRASTCRDCRLLRVPPGGPATRNWAQLGADFHPVHPPHRHMPPDAAHE